MQTLSSCKSGSRVIAIEIHERLDLSVHSTFVEACELAALPGPRAIEVNLGKTHYVQDSGLAMLLMLRSCAGRLRNRIRLINCSPEIRRRLEAHSMDSHFHLA
jgi:anti-anti-sigma regulatory factor